MALDELMINIRAISDLGGFDEVLDAIETVQDALYDLDILSTDVFSNFFSSLDVAAGQEAVRTVESLGDGLTDVKNQAGTINGAGFESIANGALSAAAATESLEASSSQAIELVGVIDRSSFKGVINGAKAGASAVSNIGSAASVSNEALADLNHSFTKDFGLNMSSMKDFAEGLGQVEQAYNSVLNSLGISDMWSQTIGKAGKAEVNKVILGTMTETKAGANELFNILDESTNNALVSIDSVIPAINQFATATGASDSQLMAHADTFVQFGSKVLAMTGSTELSQTAMEGLYRGLQGSFELIDDYGYTMESLKATGYWSGEEEDIEGYMKAIQVVNGDLTELMSTNEGLMAQIQKAFSSGGKEIGNWIMPLTKEFENLFIMLNSNNDKWPVRIILSLMTALGGLLQSVNTLAIVWPTLSTSFGIMKAVMLALTRQINWHTAASYINRLASGQVKEAQDLLTAARTQTTAATSAETTALNGNTTAHVANATSQVKGLTNSKSMFQATKNLTLAQTQGTNLTKQMIMSAAAHATSLGIETEATITATGAQEGFNAAAYTNPYIALAAAIILLVGALAYLSITWGGNTDAMGKWNKMLEEGEQKVADKKKSVEQYSKQLEDLRKQRDNLNKQGKDTTKINEEIKQSYKNQAIAAKNAEIAERDYNRAKEIKEEGDKTKARKELERSGLANKAGKNLGIYNESEDSDSSGAVLNSIAEKNYKRAEERQDMINAEMYSDMNGDYGQYLKKLKEQGKITDEEMKKMFANREGTWDWKAQSSWDYTTSTDGWTKAKAFFGMMGADAELWIQDAQSWLEDAQIFEKIGGFFEDVGGFLTDPFGDWDIWQGLEDLGIKFPNIGAWWDGLFEEGGLLHFDLGEGLPSLDIFGGIGDWWNGLWEGFPDLSDPFGEGGILNFDFTKNPLQGILDWWNSIEWPKIDIFGDIMKWWNGLWGSGEKKESKSSSKGGSSSTANTTVKNALPKIDLWKIVTDWWNGLWKNLPHIDILGSIKKFLSNIFKGESKKSATGNGKGEGTAGSADAIKKALPKPNMWTILTDWWNGLWKNLPTFDLWGTIKQWWSTIWGGGNKKGGTSKDASTVDTNNIFNTLLNPSKLKMNAINWINSIKNSIPKINIFSIIKNALFGGGGANTNAGSGVSAGVTTALNSSKPTASSSAKGLGSTIATKFNAGIAPISGYMNTEMKGVSAAITAWGIVLKAKMVALAATLASILPWEWNQHSPGVIAHTMGDELGYIADFITEAQKDLPRKMSTLAQGMMDGFEPISSTGLTMDPAVYNDSTYAPNDLTTQNFATNNNKNENTLHVNIESIDSQEQVDKLVNKLTMTLKQANDNKGL